MTDTYDVAWLYSSVLQASAALVAIVGGFLVSRSISEKQVAKEVAIQNRSIRLRIEELHQQRYDVLGERANLWISNYDDALLRHVGRSDEDFPTELEPALPEYLASESFDSHRTSRREFVERTEKFLSHQLEGFPDTDLVGYGTLSDKVEIEIYEAIRSRFQARAASDESPIARFSRAFANSVSDSRSFVQPLADKTLEKLKKLDSHIDVLQAELSAIDLKNRIRLGTADIRHGAWYLSFATLLGAVYPLILMAWKPMPQQAPWRVSVVICFVLALVSILWFIVHLVDGAKVKKSGVEE